MHNSNADWLGAPVAPTRLYSAHPNLTIRFRLSAATEKRLTKPTSGERITGLNAFRWIAISLPGTGHADPNGRQRAGNRRNEQALVVRALHDVARAT